MQICSVCKRKTFCDEHHPDRINRPSWTVVLCPTCHRETHTGAIITFDNAASRQAQEWARQKRAGGKFVHPRHLLQKLDELRYKPAHDFQIEAGFDSEEEWGKWLIKNAKG